MNPTTSFSRRAFLRTASCGFGYLGLASLLQATARSAPYRYHFKQTNGPLLRIITIDRDASFALLDQALARIVKFPPSSKP